MSAFISDLVQFGFFFFKKDMNHYEREKSGIPSSRPRAKPLPNPSATVFVSNVREPSFAGSSSITFFLFLISVGIFRELAKNQRCFQSGR